MKKLSGYEETYYPERWQHKNICICKLTDHSFLIFDKTGEKVIKCCKSLEDAKQYIKANFKILKPICYRKTV